MKLIPLPRNLNRLAIEEIAVEELPALIESPLVM
jgi:hypothetical protein